MAKNDRNSLKSSQIVVFHLLVNEQSIEIDRITSIRKLIIRSNENKQ